MPVSRRESNATCGAVSGPSRHGPCKGTIRPLETIAVPSASDRPRPEGDVQIGPVDGRYERESGRWRNARGFALFADADGTRQLRQEHERRSKEAKRPKRTSHTRRTKVMATLPRRIARRLKVVPSSPGRQSILSARRYGEINATSLPFGRSHRSPPRGRSACSRHPRAANWSAP
jgi:hypothetical protein